MAAPVVVPMTLAVNTVGMILSIPDARVQIPAEVDAAYHMDDIEIYSGALSVTPTDAQQTLPTGNKRFLADLVVEPVPQSYGHVQRSGDVLLIY